MKKSANLIVVALAVAALAIAVTMSDRQQDKRESFEPKPLFGEIDLGNIAGIEITGGDETVSIEKINREEWGVASRADYPADAERLRRHVFDIAELKAVQKMTDNPEKYERLGLGDEPAGGTIALLDSDGDPLAKLYLGNERESKAAAGMGGVAGRFVRVEGDPAVYLVSENVRLDQDLKLWLQNEVIEVDIDNIQRVAVDNRLTSESLEMEREKTNPFEIVTPIPPGRTAAPGKLSPVGRALAKVTLNDVTTDDLLGSATLQREADYSAIQKNGLVYHAEASKLDDKYCVRLSASYDKAFDLSLSDEVTSDSQLAKTLPPAEEEVEKINERHGKWIYMIPKFAWGHLTQKLTDVTKEIEPEKDIEANRS